MLYLQYVLVVIVHSFTVSGGLMVLQMISRVVAVRGVSSGPALAHVLVVVAMGTDAIMRLMAGGLSAHFSTLHSRCLLLACGAAAHAIAQITFMLPAPALGAGAVSVWGADTHRLPTVLFVGCVLLGVSDGVIWSVVPSVFIQLFTVKRASTFFSISVLTSAVMCVVLVNAVEPTVYSAHPVDPVTGECASGLGCFRITHVIALWLACVAVLSALTVMTLARLQNPICTP